MKKNSVVFIAALLFFSCNDKKETNKNTDLMVDNLKGEVQKVIETPYKVDSTGKMGEMDSCCLNLNEYDSAGNILKYTSKDSKGNITSEQTFTKYDNGLFKEITTTAKGKTTNRVSIQIDKDGKYSTAQNYDSTGKISSTYKDIAINDYNEITSIKEYKPDSSVKSTSESVYDKQYWKGSTSKDSSGKEVFKGEQKYDDKMNPIEYTNTTTTLDSTHKYVAKTKTIKYKYDSYDDQGNWTQRTEMDEKSKPTKIYKREITYYKK